MKKTIKKALAMLLVVCMALPMLVMPIAAEGDNEGTDSVDGFSYVYDPSNRVLTITVTSWTGKLTSLYEKGWAFRDEVEEIVVKRTTNGFDTIQYAAFQKFPKLRKVTIPAAVQYLNSNQQFNAAKSFKELVVTGNAYIPGAADLSNILSISGGYIALNSGNHRTFEQTAIETLILKGGVYSDELPIKTTSTSQYAVGSPFGTSLKNIMGPYNDTYLRKFAAENGYNYIPFGKIGTGTAWTYDENAKTITIYGDGTGSALTAISEDGAAYPAETTTVIIRSDIISISENALAELENLEIVIFEGNVPAAEADPFGGKAVACYKEDPDATVPNVGYWADKTVSACYAYGEYDGAITEASEKSKWEFNALTKTLTISNASTTGSDRVQTKTAAEGGWSDHISQIEHIVISGTEIERISQNAFVNHTALKTVTMPATLHTIGANAFQGCTSLTTISVNNEAVIPGIADFSHGARVSGNASSSGIQLFRTDYSNSAYKNTAIEGIILPTGAPAISKPEFLSEKQKSIIIGYNDTSAEVHKAFCENNRKTLKYYGKTEDKKITWIYDPGDKSLSIYGTGAFASFNLAEGYEDFLKDVKTLYIDEGITSIGADAFTTVSTFIMKCAGVSVRYKDYNGLRNLYDFSNNVDNQMVKFGYSLVEYGAMVVSSNKLDTRELTIDAATLEPTIGDAIKKAIWNGNGQVGKVLSYEASVKTKFALTLTNYTDHWDSGVYSRAYAVYEDASGNRYVAYADNGNAVSLYDAMVSGCLQRALNNLICDDVAVWNVLATGKVENGDIDAGEGIEAMVINGKTDADAKVLVVRMANGELADDTAIAAAKAAAVAAGYTALNDTVIALDFLA